MLFATAAAFVVIALAAIRFGPWEIEQGWLRVSVTTPYKPFSVAAALAVLGACSTATVRSAFQKRSPFAFYLVAASVLFMCSLGPQPTLLGERVLYEPPYAWLMRLPFFADSVRVPARFAMLGLLALSVAASLAFHRLSRPETRRVALVVVVIGILFDGWMRGLPMAAVPRSVYTIPQGERPAAVLELPLGDVWRDTAAIYRATLHGVRAVNGYNGFEPIYYQVLRRGLADHDPTILDALASSGPILIAADHAADPGGRTAAFLAAHPRLTRLHDDGTWTLYWLSRDDQAPLASRCEAEPIAIAAASDADGEIGVVALTDRNPGTRWIVAPQENADGEVVFDLGGLHHACEIDLSMGAAAVYHPGSIEVATSTDALTWERAFTGQMAGAALRAALADPRDSRFTVPLQGRAARFVRLRADYAGEQYPWAIADVVVR